MSTLSSLEKTFISRPGAIGSSSHYGDYSRPFTLKIRFSIMLSSIIKPFSMFIPRFV